MEMGGFSSSSTALLFPGLHYISKKAEQWHRQKSLGKLEISVASSDLCRWRSMYNSISEVASPNHMSIGISTGVHITSVYQQNTVQHFLFFGLVGLIGNC
jgi:hypothetical protein